MKVLLNKEVDLNKWNDLLNRAEQSSPFQTPAYYEFFNSMENLSATVHAVEQSGKVEALCVVTLQKEKGLKGYFSRRAIIYGGPLIHNQNQKALYLLLKSIRSYYRNKTIYIEIRSYFDYSMFQNQFLNSKFKYIPWLNYQVNCLNMNEVKSSMSKSRLRQIKKAIKNGAEWKEASQINEIKEFYKILEDLYQTKIKKPLLPESFFTHFFEKNLGKFLLVYYQHKITGGIMCPIYPNKTIYEFYVCGLDQEYKDQYPSVMATWAAIEYANQNNILMFDFMGAGQPKEDYGVREFKKRFGGQEVEYGRYIHVLNPALYIIGKIGLKIISILK